MRLRLTIVTTLAVGMLVSGPGAGFASQGFGQSEDNASAAQYGAPNQPEQPLMPVQGANQPERVLVVVPPIDDVQEPRQVEAGSSLASTGFAALPVLLLGLAIFLTGLALRCKAARED